MPRRLVQMPKLHPLEDRIVVRPGESEETTASGLVIPDTAKEKPQQGEVLAVGPGRRGEDSGELIPLDVAVGDTVVYSKYGGTEISVEGEDLLILAGRDIRARVDKSPRAATLAAGGSTTDRNHDQHRPAGRAMPTRRLGCVTV